MSNKRRYDVRSMRQAIKRHGADVRAVARAMNCSTSTIYTYRKKYAEIEAAWLEAGGDQASGYTKHDLDTFLRAINGSRGIKAAVANNLGVALGTVDNYLERWPVAQVALERERKSLVDFAQSKLLRIMANDDHKNQWQAVAFTLETLGKDDGYSKRTEHTGKDGQNLFNLSSDTMRLIEALDIDASQVAAQFEQMVRAAAAMKGIE